MKELEEISMDELVKLSKRKRNFDMICKTETSEIASPVDFMLGVKTIERKRNTKQSLMQSDDFSSKVYHELPIKVTSYAHRIFEQLRKDSNITIE